MQRSKLFLGLAASAVFLITRSSLAAFGAGDLIVLSTPNSGTAAGQITLSDYAFNPATGTFTTPATAHPLTGLTLAGTSDHDGLLHKSTDGSTLVFGGYQAAVGTTGLVASGATRAIGAVDSNFNLTTTPITGYAGVAVRSVVATDSKHFWTGGDQGVSGGQYYVDASGPSTTQTLITADDARANRIDRGQLWAVSSGTNGATKVGVGLPTSAAANVLAMGDNGGALVKSDVVFLDLNNDNTSETAYTTDGKNLLGKWSFNGTAWSQTGSWTGDKNFINNINALEVYVYNGAVHLLAATTVTATTGGQLFNFTDTNGINANFGAAFLASTKPTAFFTADSNTVFRGLAIVPEPTSMITLASLFMIGRRRRSENA